SGTWWKCCNIGIGAMLHEVGHALTCPHSPSGIMMRGFNNLNRTFTVAEPNFNSPITPADEGGAHWHRCDTIRFRYHPCFRLPSDKPKLKSKDLHPDFWPLTDAVLICCYSGVSLIEVYVNDRFRYHEEYTDDRLHNGDIKIKVLDIKTRLKWKSGERIKIKVIAKNQTESELDDVQSFPDDQQINLPIYGRVLKSAKLGRGGGQDFQAIFRKPNESHTSESYLTKIIIRFESYISSITFFWSDNTVLTSGQGGINEYILDLDRDEKVLGFKVRSGWWLDALKIKTNKRSSGWIGGEGGGLHYLQVPKGHEIVGIFGSSTDRVTTSFGVFYKKLTKFIENQTENELYDVQTSPDRQQVNISSYGRIIKGAKLGKGGGQDFRVIFRKPKDSHTSELHLVKIIIRSGNWVDSIKLFWSDDTVSTFGSGGSNEYILALDKDEKILGFNVRSGWWLDALEIKTNKKNSGLIGGSGGDFRHLQVPKGHELVGIFGSNEDSRITSFGILYRKS
ncbi:12279_t:CDS:2, partial [Acaulospora morrowiae]